MIDVAVLAGGCSPEHDVSLRSAQRVQANLDRRRYRVWPVLLDRDGTWWPGLRPLAASEGLPNVNADVRTDSGGVGTPGAGMSGADGDPASWLRVAGAQPMRPGAALDCLLDRGIDVVFPVLHGPFGEDGTVQGMLELHGVAFVGSGCAASAVAMDKVRTRECYEAHGVPVAKGFTALMPRTATAADALARAMMAAVGLPCFLKVDTSGSTLGVGRAQSKADIVAFLRRHAEDGRRVLAEELLVGEEITVAVLGNTGGDVEALPAIGIYPTADGYFTHAAKYEPGRTEEIIPPRGMDREALDDAGRLAVRCHEALQCDGMSRTDMIHTARGLRVLETNTIPGMTDQSLLPQAALAGGYDYPKLLDRLIELGLDAAATRRAPFSGVAARG